MGEEIGPWEIPRSPNISLGHKIRPKAIPTPVVKVTKRLSPKLELARKRTYSHVPLKPIFIMDTFKLPPDHVRIESIAKSRPRSRLRAARKLSFPYISDSPKNGLSARSRMNLTPMHPKKKSLSPSPHLRADSEVPKLTVEKLLLRCDATLNRDDPTTKNWSKVLAGRPLAPLKQQNADLEPIISALERRLTRLLASSRRRCNLSVS